jgi:hypothetical protein
LLHSVYHSEVKSNRPLTGPIHVHIRKPLFMKKTYHHLTINKFYRGHIGKKENPWPQLLRIAVR